MKSEIRNPKSDGSPNAEPPRATQARVLKAALPVSDFGFRISLGIRNSEFGFCVAALLLAFSLHAQTKATKPTFHASLKAAAESAATDQSLVLLVFGAEWCGPCKLLKKNTLAASEFLDGAGPLRIAEVDIDADQKTTRSFDVNAVPALLLLTADGKIVARRTGFVDAKQLLDWLAAGRERVSQGQWEGVSPGLQLDAFTARAAAGRLTEDDLKKLVAMLAQPEPAERHAVGRLLLEQREQAVPLLIEAVGDSYLGVRIAAVEILRRLAPEKIIADPWQSPGELTNTIAALKTWWAETGKLPSPTVPRPSDPATAGSIKTALSDLAGDDPRRRTDAMSTLVAHGAAALPAVREALKRGERAGDQRSVAILEDVRWAILVPDALERRVDGVRHALARGASAQRQAAALRLGRGGREAIPALAELVNEADALVVESAVRSLSGIGGVDALPALSALLKASDSNLRMTAAQALGHSKNKGAVTPLLTVVNDPNEVVACTALSALEELNSTRSYSSSRRALSPEVIAALKVCLVDSRWRVRAAAAEVAGKLQAKEVVPELKAVLDDADGFVTKNTLEALAKLGAAPDSLQLAALAQRQTALRGQVVKLLVQSPNEEAVQAVLDIYTASGTEERIAVLRGLDAPETGDEQSLDSPWKPLLARAVVEVEVRVRRAAAETLGAQGAKLAAELVGPLLSDEDAGTRTAAATAVLAIIGGERLRVRSQGTPFMRDFGDFEFSEASARGEKRKTNEPPATAAQIAAWHDALKQKAKDFSLSDGSDLMIAAAMFVTGESNVELPGLQAALRSTNKAALVVFANSPALAAVLPRLPWPASQPLLERFCAEPDLFVATLPHAGRLASPIGDYLFEPARFRSAIEPATGEVLERALPMLLNTPKNSWSLLSAQPRAVAVVTALLDATNAAWRAAAVYALSQRDPEMNLATFEKAAQDANPWVRLAALRGLSHAVKDRAALETRLGGLLSASDKRVARRAALGLLEPEVRAAAGLEFELDYFQFEKVHAGDSRYSGSDAGEQRPLKPLENKPAFLEPVAQSLTGGEPEDIAVFALLLAQYGDFTGVDRLVQNAAGEIAEDNQMLAAALVGIALSRDPKYLPYLRKVTEQAKQDWDYRKVLQALRGVSGAEARDLRVDINKRMRQTAE